MTDETLPANDANDGRADSAERVDLTTSRKRWGIHTPATLRVRARELDSAGYLIEGLVPTRSIGLLLGDSGLGKSPLMYQAAICVASGLPFLGRKTRKGRVLIADFENGINDILGILEKISQHLGLPEPPSNDDLLLWTLTDCDRRYGQPGYTLPDMLRELKPDLAIVDSLGSYDPQAEEKNSAANLLLQDFRKLARDVGTSAYFVHHRRKQSRKADERTAPLEVANIRQWFEDARGASALINGSDVRLGLAEPDISAMHKDDAALVLRGFGRLRGEIGPLYLARIMDDAGEPLGYRELIGPELLMNVLQEDAFNLLPAQFRFADAKRIYKRSDQPTRNFLVRCINFGIVRQLARGSYEKVEPVEEVEKRDNLNIINESAL